MRERKLTFTEAIQSPEFVLAQRSRFLIVQQGVFEQLECKGADRCLSRESVDKIRDVLSSVLGSAVKYGYLVTNPAGSLQLLPAGRGARRHKPFVRSEQFASLVELIEEPYATMFYVAVYTGLRVSEVLALRWSDIHVQSITIDARCCRGDWAAPKSDASNTTVPVNGRSSNRFSVCGR